MKTKTTSGPRSIPYVVHRLLPAQRDEIAAHLRALAHEDLALRFGVAMDAESIARYVDAIDFERGAVLGAIARDGTLAGVAHIGFDGALAEVGLSVLAADRQRGVAWGLASAALREAERLGADELCIHFAATNRGMRRIVDRLGMQVTNEGSEVTARRRVRLAATRSSPRAARGPWPLPGAVPIAT